MKNKFYILKRIILLLWVGVLFFVSAQVRAIVLEPEVIPPQKEGVAEFTSSSTDARKIDFLITSSEVEEAGFKDVIKLTPLGKRFESPMQYFRVQTSNTLNTSTADCEDCNSLLSIYITSIIATGTPAWVKSQNPFIEELHGRTRLKLFVAGRVLFITSPDNSALQSLMQKIRERIILNKTS